MIALAQALLFNTTCDVYTPDPTSKLFTVLDRSALPCRLAHNRTGAGEATAVRTEAMATRRLIWPHDYAMPAYAEVESDGVRWHVVAGTPNDYLPELPIYNVALVVRGEPPAAP